MEFSTGVYTESHSANLVFLHIGPVSDTYNIWNSNQTLSVF